MKYYILLLLGCLLSLSVLAQDANIRGFVYDEANGEAIIFTNVYLEGTTYGAPTDINGFYSIPKVPAGDYTLICTYLGYDTSRTEISVSPGEILNQQIYLKENSVILDVVEISAEKQEAKTEVRTSTINVSPKQINKIPAVGGEPDLAQYLQVLPGVVFTGDQGGQLYVRGGSPIQTKVLLDGLTIYNPFHSIGLFSVFETDVIKNVDVLTGGFNAEYGGRISAIVDVATKDGNKKELEGKISVNPLMSKAVIEGPLVRLNDDGASASFIVALKNSYLDQSSKIFYPYINSGLAQSEDPDENIGLPYNFNDIYAKVSVNSRTGNKLSLFGYDFRDNTDFPQVAKYSWKASGGGFNFVIVPNKSKFLIDGKFAYSRYNIDLAGQTSSENRNSSVGGFNFIVSFNNFLPNGKLVYGLDAAGFRTSLLNGISENNRETNNTTEIAGFLTYKMELGKLLLEPSLRAVNYASINSSQLEPRFGLKYNFSNTLRFKFSTGRYTQNLLSTKSDRDVVGLFTGFLTAPEGNLSKYVEVSDGQYELEEVKKNVQIANHFIAGVEVDLTKRLNMNIEGYYKDFEQLITVNRNRIFSGDPVWIVEDGEAYGVDFLLKYDYQRWYLWGVYSLGFVTRTGPSGGGIDAVATYPPHYDRRHNLNLLASYTAGKNSDWELSMRWNLGSGFPFTKTQGFYESIDFSDGISADYITQNPSEVEVIFDSELNGGRLPFYHRLDASVKKYFTLGPEVKLEVVGSVTNVYNRENIFFFDRVEYERVNQLPILPSLGITLSF